MITQRRPVVTFLCGCAIEPKDVAHVDADGFIHCPNHPGIRRYGWRSRGKSYGITLEENEKLFWSTKGIIIVKDGESYQILNPSTNLTNP